MVPPASMIVGRASITMIGCCSGCGCVVGEKIAFLLATATVLTVVVTTVVLVGVVVV